MEKFVKKLLKDVNGLEVKLLLQHIKNVIFQFMVKIQKECNVVDIKINVIQ